jgi:hypothetical protein
MSATSRTEREIETLDDVLSCLAYAADHQRVALLNIVNQARPDEDHIITELLAARREILKAKKIIAGWHPNRRSQINNP